MRYLLLDVSNLLYRNFYANPNEDVDTIVGLTMHSALVTMNKYRKMFKPHQIIMCHDRSSWRKTYTASEACISKKPYKGNRRQDMTAAQEAKFARFISHLREFEKLITEHTTVISMAEETLEADDLIAGFVQVYEDDENEIIIISADSDLLQLTRYRNVRVVSPATDKDQSLDEYDNDPVYYVFQKCVRGDPTDNVQSAYPRVRSTKIKQAYEDPEFYVQFMEEKWVNENKVEFTVKDLFKENQILIDLEKQPNDIRMRILETIDREMNKKRQFSMFHFLQFVGKHQLVKIKESMDQYLPLLSNKKIT
jgi:5'-3' exonuclease